VVGRASPESPSDLRNRPNAAPTTYPWSTNAAPAGNRHRPAETGQQRARTSRSRPRIGPTRLRSRRFAGCRAPTTGSGFILVPRCKLRRLSRGIGDLRASRGRRSPLPPSRGSSSLRATRPSCGWLPFLRSCLLPGGSAVPMPAVLHLVRAAPHAAPGHVPAFGALQGRSPRSWTRRTGCVCPVVCGSSGCCAC
jgi:hypothetical protein